MAQTSIRGQRPVRHFTNQPRLDPMRLAGILTRDGLRLRTTPWSAHGGHRAADSARRLPSGTVDLTVLSFLTKADLIPVVYRSNVDRRRYASLTGR
jgi:hypothetical protein